MTMLSGDLDFINVIENPRLDLAGIDKETQDKILGPAWGLRPEAELKEYVKSCIDYGYRNVAACRAIVTAIREHRSKKNPLAPNGEWGTLFLVANDAISGFDSEGGLDMQESNGPQLSGKVTNYARSIEKAFAEDTLVRRFSKTDAPAPKRQEGAMPEKVDCQWCKKKGVNPLVHYNPSSAFMCKSYPAQAAVKS